MGRPPFTGRVRWRTRTSSRSCCVPVLTSTALTTRSRAPSSSAARGRSPLLNSSVTTAQRKEPLRCCWRTFMRVSPDGRSSATSAFRSLQGVPLSRCWWPLESARKQGRSSGLPHRHSCTGCGYCQTSCCISCSAQ
eukprot:Amastigsp_a349789_5.p3 type:complete len:136 gc:universal Amastigsp_a349789_5:380-787(+)